jgi:hypothetical protein
MRFASASLLALASTIAACTTTVHGTGATSDAIDADQRTTESQSVVMTNDGVVTGLWAGRTYLGEDVRMRLGARTIDITTWCSNGETSRVVAGAEVTWDAIRILEHKTAADASLCGVQVFPKVIRRCATAESYDCFVASGSTLVFQSIGVFMAGGAGHETQFEKVADG